MRDCGQMVAASSSVSILAECATSAHVGHSSPEQNSGLDGFRDRLRLDQFLKSGQLDHCGK